MQSGGGLVPISCSGLRAAVGAGAARGPGAITGGDISRLDSESDEEVVDLLGSQSDSEAKEGEGDGPGVDLAAFMASAGAEGQGPDHGPDAGAEAGEERGGQVLTDLGGFSGGGTSYIVPYDGCVSTRRTALAVAGHLGEVGGTDVASAGGGLGNTAMPLGDAAGAMPSGSTICCLSGVRLRQTSGYGDDDADEVFGHVGA